MSSNTPQSFGRNQPPAPAGRNKKLILLIAAGCLILAAVLILVLTGKNKSTSDEQAAQPETTTQAAAEDAFDQMENFSPIEEVDSNTIVESSVSGIATPNPATYQQPKELGTDLLSGNFELDGKLYSLPCPLQEFLDAGWTIGDQYEYTGDRPKGGKDLSGVTFELVKDSAGWLMAEVDVRHKNQTDLESAIVYSVDVGSVKSDLFHIPGGIKLNDDYDTATAAVQEFMHRETDKSQYGSTIIVESDGNNTRLSLVFFGNEEHGYHITRFHLERYDWHYSN